MRFTQEVLDGLKEEFKEEDLPSNLLFYLFLKAKIVSGNLEGYIDSYYYGAMRELLEIYKLGSENIVPTLEEICEERDFNYN